MTNKINLLNWTIQKKPLFDANGKELPIYGTFRSDNNHFLGAVTDRYTIIQNEELFKMGEALSSEVKDVKLVRSGEVAGGQRVFATFEVPFLSIDVRKKGDIVKAELMISTRHDGTGSLHSSLMSKRLVCTNGATLPVSLNNHSIRHSLSSEEKIQEAKKLISNLTDEFKSFGIVANSLAEVKLEQDEIGEILNTIYYKDELNNLLTSTQKQNQARSVLALYQNNDDDKILGIRDTAWSLFNAFTRFVDHVMSFRVGANEDEEQSRDRGTLFGTGESLKNKALFAIVQNVHKNRGIDVPAHYLKAAKDE